MSNKSASVVVTMGIDIGKNSCHVIGLDQRGAIVLRQKWWFIHMPAASRPAAYVQPNAHN